MRGEFAIVGYGLIRNGSRLQISTTPKSSGKRGSLRKAAIVALALLVGATALFLVWRRVLRSWIEETPPGRLAAVAVGVWITTAAALYIWRRASLAQARSRARRTLDRFVGDSQAQFDDLLEQTVGLAAVTLEWAVRAELMRDDIQDTQEYMQQLAKRPRVKRALVSNAGGLVIAASDPDSCGQRLDQTVDDPPAESSGVQVLTRPDGALRLVIPVMGLEARLGTLLVEYERPVLSVDVDSAS